MDVYSPVPAKRGLLAGLSPRFYVRPGTSDAKAIEEVWTQRNHVRPRLGFYPVAGERWLDLGSNVGAFAVLAAKLGAQVVCVEAEPTNASICRANLELNGVSGTVIESAIVPDSYGSESVVLYVNSAPMALRRHSILHWRKHARPLDVPALRISDAVRLHAPDAIKINIEGVEVDILREWDPPSSVRGIVFEWSFEAETRMEPFRRVIERLRDRYPNVRMNKGMDLSREVADFYPPNVYVFAWR